MDNYAEASNVLRRRDRDRYLADLYAPAAVRPHLFALHAFAAEIARIREVVSEPTLGELRVQWWRDAIAAGDAAGHPVAAALIDTVKACRLPAAALDLVIEGRIFDLYDDPMRALDDLEGYAGETASAVLQLTALILNGGSDPGSADASGHGGVAETLVGILLGLSTRSTELAKYLPDQALAEHRVERGEIAARDANPRVLALLAALRALARSHLGEATRAAARVPRAVLAAYLPLAVARARLDRLDRSAATPFAVSDLPGWRRQWIIWRAARRPSPAA